MLGGTTVRTEAVRPGEKQLRWSRWGVVVVAWWKRCDSARSGGRRVPVKAGRGG